MTITLEARCTCLSIGLTKNITDNNIDAKGYNKLTAGITPRKNLNIKAYHVTIGNIGSRLV